MIVPDKTIAVFPIIPTGGLLEEINLKTINYQLRKIINL